MEKVPLMLRLGDEGHAGNLRPHFLGRGFNVNLGVGGDGQRPCLKLQLEGRGRVGRDEKNQHGRLRPLHAPDDNPPHTRDKQKGRQGQNHTHHKLKLKQEQDDHKGGARDPRHENGIPNARFFGAGRNRDSQAT